MYFSLELQNNYTSNLNKIAEMSIAISAIVFSDFGQGWMYRIELC